MLFLTQIKNNKRPSSSHHLNPTSATRQKSAKFIKQNFDDTQVSKSKSVYTFSRRQRSNIELQKSIQVMKNKSKAKQKWHTILQLFRLFKEGDDKNGQTDNRVSGTTSPQVCQLTNTYSVTFSKATTSGKTNRLRSDSKNLLHRPFTESNFNKLKSKNSYQIQQIVTEEFIKHDDNNKIQRFNLFECLLKAQLTQRKYRFNIPQTILIDQQRVFQLLRTEREVITKKAIQKTDIHSIFENAHQASLQKVKKALNQRTYSQMYQNFIDTKNNPMAPFVVICVENKQNLSMEIESVRNFGENRWDWTRSCYVQRYIFSRNLKAMVLRTVYERAQRGQQRQQYTLHRFQNYAGIFRVNNNNGYNDFLDFKAKVSPSYNREYTLEYSKLTGPGVLNRFIEPTSQVRRLIETVHKQRVKKLWVDFCQDVSGAIWVIGVKGVQFEETKQQIKKSLWEVSVQVGSCRLCNGVFEKSQLQNSVSVRMLLEFLHHLRRRTKVECLQDIQFANMSALNRKEKAMSAVCECCYTLIIKQLTLKKCQIQLGRLCNINLEEDIESLKTEEKEMLQWRLMVYLEQIQQETKDFHGELMKKRIENVTIRYVLAKGMEEKWKCRVDQKKISVKRVKVHYFFSQSDKIEDFLKNTQILVSVLSSDRQEKEEVIAQGSTSILANFRHKFVTENGQRQTTTVLLFFQSGKYCALTLKVGLVCDGMYKVPQMPMKKINSVEFPSKECLNSNPLPKEWMEAFGYDEEIQLKDVRYQDLLKNKANSTSKAAIGLKKTKMRNFW